MESSEWLDQIEEGNAIGGHAGEVEIVPYPTVSPSMTSRRASRRRADKGVGRTVSSADCRLRIRRELWIDLGAANGSSVMSGA